MGINFHKITKINILVYESGWYLIKIISNFYQLFCYVDEKLKK